MNPLQPYYLLYIRDDGIVRFSFAHPKLILDMYRVLCLDKKVPYEDLCNLFDQQTQSGANMTFYNDLLRKTVESIAHTYRKREADKIVSSRAAVLTDLPQQVNETSDFELITWLVIKERA